MVNDFFALLVDACDVFKGHNQNEFRSGFQPYVKTVLNFVSQKRLPPF